MQHRGFTLLEYENIQGHDRHSTREKAESLDMVTVLFNVFGVATANFLISILFQTKKHYPEQCMRMELKFHSSCSRHWTNVVFCQVGMKIMILREVHTLIYTLECSKSV